MFFPDEPYFNVHDGVLSVLGFADERPVTMWSHYQAQALIQRLEQFGHRERIAQWTLADTERRLAERGPAASAAHRARLEACVTKAREELAGIRAALVVLRSRRDVMEAARRADSYAPRESPFLFNDEPAPAWGGDVMPAAAPVR